MGCIIIEDRDDPLTLLNYAQSIYKSPVCPYVESKQGIVVSTNYVYISNSSLVVIFPMFFRFPLKCYVAIYSTFSSNRLVARAYNEFLSEIYRCVCRGGCPATSLCLRF